MTTAAHQKPQVWGLYCRVYATNHTRTGERTNLGVIMFAEDGRQIGCRADTVRRAIDRGDLSVTIENGEVHPDELDYWNKYVAGFVAGYRTVDEVKKSHQSIGHAMSVIQLGELLPVDIAHVTLDGIFERDVLGKKR